MPRALLTGATGFIGAHLARRLADAGHELHLLVKPGSDRWRLDGLAGSLVHEAPAGAEADLVREIGPEWVFNLAAHGAYPSQQDVAQMWRTNVKLTVDLARAALESGASAFVQAGSSSEYGFRQEPPAEDAAPAPNSDYAVTKAAASLYCGYAGRQLGLPAVVLRLYSVYGPWEEPSRLVPTLLRRGIDGELPQLVDPATARDFVYVDDVADAFIAAAEQAPQHPGAVYNVGSGIQTTVGELVDRTRRLLSVRAEPHWGSMPARGWDTSSWVSDPRRIREELGWVATTTLDEGLAATASWLRESAERLELYRQRASPRG